ncbi:fimbrial biogenesis chaperone [Yersinia aleksiciae]|uniref:Molecular chaperone n=1 Tax=Yersinia aleksiciae TaxID=263819 RepID=A0A0T9TFF1_YERAE|nr:molecular chaperone [Yersinia aleksiciae]AKP32277.1 molecular chaperone [Yersinia aleksiciae]CFQ34906.1 putative chaperone protein [Yersinia aleksiciae]CNK79313.1 putative chaperone protein [Yersinia aleksiciae]
MNTLWHFLIQAGRQSDSRRGLLITATLVTLVCSTVAQAGVAIGLTRVIVTGDDKAGSVQILNDGPRPALLQLWVDNNISEMDTPIEQIKVPFVVDTPVFRLNPKTNKSVRIYYTGKASQLPSDRESMFWLNVLEVPPKTATTQAANNEVQIAFRSRIKLFYRPAGIPASSEGITRQLSFKWIPQGKSAVLRVTNPTPFNVTFQTLEIAQNKSATKTAIKLSNDDMVGPKSSVDGVLVDNKVPTKNMTVFFSIIDDFGSAIEGQQTLQ